MKIYFNINNQYFNIKSKCKINRKLESRLILKISFRKLSTFSNIIYDPNNDYYKILNMSDKADLKDIKKSFYELSLKTHPDKGGNEENFKKINVAYEILKDNETRNKYDSIRKDYYINVEEKFNVKEEGFRYSQNYQSGNKKSDTFHNKQTNQSRNHKNHNYNSNYQQNYYDNRHYDFHYNFTHKNQGGKYKNGSHNDHNSDYRYNYDYAYNQDFRWNSQSKSYQSYNPNSNSNSKHNENNKDYENSNHENQYNTHNFYDFEKEYREYNQSHKDYFHEFYEDYIKSNPNFKYYESKFNKYYHQYTNKNKGSSFNNEGNNSKTMIKNDSINDFNYLNDNLISNLDKRSYYHFQQFKINRKTQPPKNFKFGKFNFQAQHVHFSKNRFKRLDEEMKDYETLGFIKRLIFLRNLSKSQNNPFAIVTIKADEKGKYSISDTLKSYWEIDSENIENRLNLNDYYKLVNKKLYFFYFFLMFLLNHCLYNLNS